VFRKEDKVSIGLMLDDLNIHQIEAGMPAVSREDEESIRELVKRGLDRKMYALARATVSIWACLRSSFPNSRRQIRGGQLASRALNKS
jgi:isopropylmalate/homocitrate/citramalate synthase